MSFHFRERWTEDDVNALPAAEQNYFDRKSGALFARSDGRATLGKAVSAFANSGGGYLLLGVRDDGTFDGVEPRRGNTDTKEWLEQLIPHLVSYPLSTFRVHVVEKSNSSQIPADKTVIVVEVGDSPHAPHQDSESGHYFFRFGSHSKPAPHHYLEALRQRTVGPVLSVELVGIVPRFAMRNRLGVLAYLASRLRVTNTGRAAALRWKTLMRLGDGCAAASDIIFGRDASFFLPNPLHRPPEAPLFPQFTWLEEQALSIQLRTRGTSKAELAEGIRAILNTNPVVKLQVYSEFPPSDERAVPLGSVLSEALADKLHWLTPGSQSNGDEFYAGSGFWCKWALDIYNKRIGGSVRNSSETTYREAHFEIRASNAAENVVFRHTFTVDSIPANETKSFNETVYNADFHITTRWEIWFNWGAGKGVDGKPIHTPVDGVEPE